MGWMSWGEMGKREEGDPFFFFGEHEHCLALLVATSRRVYAPVHLFRPTHENAATHPRFRWLSSFNIPLSLSTHRVSSRQSIHPSYPSSRV
jgi:hypothetical protein